jgi:hypothetical protein
VEQDVRMMIKRVQYDQKRISRIDQQGLCYIDEQGNECFIDFETCRRNWVIYVNTSGEFVGKNISLRDTNCVGWRSIVGKPPNIEFFSEPRTRFEFSLKLWERILGLNKRFYKDFHQLQKQIIDAGWTTMDLS